ncbi:class IIb bacteriocin, lactobin A/cerein 7B family [Streptococcus pseudopneumoniae]|uniref:Excreted peptide n=1 Tax=Streptococcus pseudopneumoniae TaxID=257758 RepID=A0A2P0A013_9STRE|nr:class IIb bacteriocin, lactobin A/cerein 7B family [Streptococcus pseudopneumoniae]CEY61027.1 excreted peptide [Streptococcus pseudopneumoniae]CIO91902.1 excreted peptide [Streptococcus pseudopneumoniae]COD08040.1 excreted peptide [Streptococcus pseudopneumoniae]
MTNFDKMEQNFVALTEEELMDVDGGALPLVIAGVSIWKIGAAVAGGAVAGGAAALGYYANRP